MITVMIIQNFFIYEVVYLWQPDFGDKCEILKNGKLIFQRRALLGQKWGLQKWAPISPYILLFS